LGRLFRRRFLVEEVELDVRSALGHMVLARESAITVSRRPVGASR
jgi:hypothetical protein